MGFSLSAALWSALGALLLLAAFWARRVGPVHPAARVVLRLPLEPRRSLVVVELAGRTLVLASSEQGLAVVAELDAAAAAALAATPAPRPGLLDVLRARRA